jgi:hypothetical protein
MTWTFTNLNFYHNLDIEKGKSLIDPTIEGGLVYSLNYETV